MMTCGVMNDPRQQQQHSGCQPTAFQHTASRSQEGRNSHSDRDLVADARTALVREHLHNTDAAAHRSDCENRGVNDARHGPPTSH